MFHPNDSPRYVALAWSLMVSLGLAALSLFALVAEARPLANIITVTNTNDSGAGSLRQALADANNGDTIQFNLPANAIITLSGQLTVTKALMVDGSTAMNLVVSGNNLTRVFSVNAPVTFNAFTIANGNASVGDGGGVSSTSDLTLTNMSLVRNTAQFGGGGAFVTGAAQVSSSLFQNNRGLNGSGGGLYTFSTLTLTNTQFLSNTASSDGGGAFVGGAMQVSGGSFENNRSTISGGGLYALNRLTLTNTQFLSNTAQAFGGGAIVFGATQVSGGVFQNNGSNSGGGGLAAASTLALTNTQFLSNASVQGGGAYAQVTLTLTNTQFLSNIAYQGSGLYHQSNSARFVNALFARNVAATTRGAALYLQSNGNVQIIHTTIASPTVANGLAIYVASGTVDITNTIVASHTVGISQTGGTVRESYNLFFANGSDRLGTVNIGGNSLNGNPAFVNVNADDYHLSTTSAAINTGVNAGVTTDFEGQTRPQLGGFDIGYDEFSFIPVVQFATPAFSVSGNVATLMATLSGPSPITTTVDYSVSSGVTGTLTLVPLATSATFTVALSSNVPVAVSLLNPTNATIGGNNPIVLPAAQQKVYLPLVVR